MKHYQEKLFDILSLYRGIRGIFVVLIVISLAVAFFQRWAVPIAFVLFILLVLYENRIVRGLRGGIRLDYMPNPETRHGYGLPTHSLLQEYLIEQESTYTSHLANMPSYLNEWLSYKDISSDDATKPAIFNPWLPPLDSFSLYYFVAHHQPKRYLEIGSGNSTKFAKAAIDQHNLETKIISIDPYPRAEIDALTDQSIRDGLETVDLSIFDKLEAGDIVYFDGSHRSFMNTDVTVFFLEILPKLPSGVICHIHDIFLPDDYPPAWKYRWYNEQYLLACYILAQTPLFTIELPNAYLHTQSKLPSSLLEPTQSAEIELTGGSFWIRMT